jgi:hypothetical protein
MTNKYHALKLLLAAIILASLIVAIPVYAYSYSAPLSISYNGTSTWSMLPIIIDSDNEYMADNGFMASSGNNTRVQDANDNDKIYMIADDKILTAIPIQAQSQTNLYMTTGNDAQTMDIITGYGGYFTVADATALDLSDNGSLVLTDVGLFATGNIVNREGSFAISYDLATESVATYFPTVNTTTLTLRPDAVGGTTQFLRNSSTYNYECIYEEVANDADWVYGDNTFDYVDTYNIPNPSSSYDVYTIASVTVYGRVSYESGSPSYFKLRVNSTDGASESITTSWVLYSETWTTNPATSAAWTWSDIASLQPGLHSAGVATPGRTKCSQLYVVVTYYTNVSTIVSGVPIGSYNVSSMLDSSNLTLTVGSSSNTTTLGGNSVIDSGNNYQVMSSAVPYIGSYKHYVGDNLIAWYEPNEMISGTTLPDRQGADNNATITWGTNPTDITASLGSLVSGTQPSPGAVITLPSPDLLPSNAGGSNWFADPDETALHDNPFYMVVKFASEAGGLSTFTETQVWRFFGIWFVLLLTAAAAMVVRGHLLIASAICCAAIWFMVHLTIFPMVILIAIVPILLVGLVMERSPSV